MFCDLSSLLARSSELRGTDALFDDGRGGCRDPGIFAMSICIRMVTDFFKFIFRGPKFADNYLLAVNIFRSTYDMVLIIVIMYVLTIYTNNHHSARRSQQLQINRSRAYLWKQSNYFKKSSRASRLMTPNRFLRRDFHQGRPSSLQSKNPEMLYKNFYISNLIQSRIIIKII